MLRSILVSIAVAASAFGQASPFVGVGNFSHIVADLDKSLAFYRDVIGLETGNPPTAYSGTPAIMKMGNTPGAQSRFVALKVPGSQLGVEIIDYKDIDRKPVKARFQDPGAANLILSVRDIDAIIAKVKKSAGRVNTIGGEPHTMALGNNGKMKVAFVQDPDGFFIELSQRDPLPQTTAPATSNVIGGNFEIMVADATQMKFYTDGLGMKLQPVTAFDPDKERMETAGTPGAQFRRTAGTIPGSNVNMAFLEFKNIDRKPLSTRVQDPGTPILQLRVADVDAAVKQMKAAGGIVVSEGGIPADFGNGRKLAIVRNSDNLFFELLPAPAR